MPLTCQHKIQFGRQFCVTDCPTPAPCGVFDYVRVERGEDVPAAEPLAVDVAVLDMNHGWPNLGHDSIVHAVLDSVCDMREALSGVGMRVRALSFDVRRGGMVPDPPPRFSLFLGTGGPGHIDPRGNDGVSPGSQGVVEDPSWEAGAFRLFDAIVADEEAALLGVCHSFGVMCRWAGAARPLLQGDAKGKSTGILDNVLAPEARRHPWFRRFAEELPDGQRLRVVENRLFDLIPDADSFPDWVVPIGYETTGTQGLRGDAITMIEFARDPGGIVPRVLGVNHHPEIVDRFRQIMILNQKRERGEVTDAWHAERLDILTRTYPDEDVDRRLHQTSDYTLLGPLRFHLYRQIRRRAEALGLELDVHEDRVLEALDRAAVDPAGAPE